MTLIYPSPKLMKLIIKVKEVHLRMNRQQLINNKQAKPANFYPRAPGMNHN